MNQLEIILADKRKELENITSKDIDNLIQKIESNLENKSLKSIILNQPNKPHYITEFKRKSPSAGWIKENANAAEICKGYEQYGSSALSILTNEKYFGGSIDDIVEAKNNVQIPILRKEFIVHEYQLYQAKAIGANIVLLIAAGLTKKENLTFAQTAKKLNLEVLLEIHAEDEFDYINEYVDFVGINNRNLKTMEVNLASSFQLAQKIPNEFIKISESGIKTKEDIILLYNAGYQAFLIGEAFMKTDNPPIAFKNLIA